MIDPSGVPTTVVARFPGESVPDDFFRDAATPFSTLGPDGAILRANRAELELLGYDESEYVGHHVSHFHVDPTIIEELLRRVRSGEALRGYESQVCAKDGSVRNVTIDAAGTWRDGTFVYAQCITRDVTPHPDAYDAELHLSAIIASSDDAIVSKDLDGIVRTWNPGAERLFGYTADEIVGRSIRIIIPADQQSEEDEVLRRVRSGERVDHFETVRQRKDGSLVPISLTVSPVKDRRGRIVGASKIARDISDRRTAEDALQESIALKDQFLALVSHELRTPISTILGNAQLLLRRGDRLDDPGRIQALEDIVTEGSRFRSIIENLLALTRLEAGRELTRVPITLASVVQEAVESVHRRVPDRPISVTVSDEDVVALGDRTLVTIVLQNLLDNADKYSAAGAPIDVSVTRDDLGNPQVRVADHGIGLADEERERIFEPFYRAAPAKTRATGMGLGLTVCRRVIEAQDGSLGVASRDGGGCTFSFSLPRADGSAS